jgi:hypothetical protein
MSHLTDEQITEAYYDGLDESAGAHIRDCEECRSAFERLSNLLEGAREYPVPERGLGYGGEVWTRLLPRLPAAAPQKAGQRWWVLAPAFAALLVVAFLAGRFSQPRPPVVAGIPDQARARVLRLSIGDHLERSGMVLSEVANSDGRSAELDDERARARDLLEQNRLLRQVVLHNGDHLRAALLDELERVLLDIANGPSKLSPQDLEVLQHRIQADGLLFRVRVLGTNTTQEGQKL